MKQNKISVHINKPIAEVFEFSINPKNTSLWSPSIIEEKTSEWPIKLGTIYSSLDRNGNWSEYKVTSFELEKSFGLDSKDGKYHVRYTYTDLNGGKCQLEYCEWVDEGDLEGPYTMETLNKLKNTIEA